MKLSGWHGRWEGKALTTEQLKPEQLNALIALHAEELTEEKLGVITKVSEEEKEVGSDEE